MIFLFVVIVVLLVSVIVAVFLKDRRAEKRRTVESLGKDMWEEIEREREEALERGKRFRKTLDAKLSGRDK